jgi:phospholipase/lecithinase/hemolysin
VLYRGLLFGLALAIAAAGAPISSLYFFGDSLSDTGNVLKATSALSDRTLGLVSEQPAAPYVGGRFTNGPVWAEHVAERLGHSGDADAAGLSMGWFGQLGGTGNNYAIGGARSGEGGALGFLDFAVPTGMATQVDFYLSRTGGVADSGGLYFLFGGGNDLRDASRIADPTERRLAAQQAGANIAYSVRDLYLAGARDFVLINSPDIGLTPEAMGDGLTQAGTDATVQFNTWFRSYGDYLSNSVPGFSLQYFDLFSLHRELVDQHGMGAVRPCKSELEACGQTLFFDSVHPTAWVHEVVGNRVADQILNSGSTQNLYSPAAETETPEPSTLVLGFSAGVFFVVIRGRRSRRPLTLTQ